MTKFFVICGQHVTGKQKILCSDKECHKERQKEHDHKRYWNNIEKEKNGFVNGVRIIKKE